MNHNPATDPTPGSFSGPTAGLDNGMTVAVTGGAGFIGSALVRALLAMDCTVHIIDDFSNGLPDNVPHAPDVHLHRLTVGPERVADLAPLVQAVDLVFHLASPIGVMQAHSARYAMMQSILASGSVMIELCRRYRRPLLVTSSSEVYGEGLARPIRETDPVTLDLAPRWGYAAAKVALEHMTAALTHDAGLPAWIVRPFNVAGARQRPGTGLVVPALVAAALRGDPLPVHGSGSQQRSFVHVEDMARGLIAVARCPALCGQAVNIGSDAPVSIGALAALVRTLVPGAPPPVHLPHDSLAGGTFRAAPVRTPDITLIRSATGWTPTRSLQDAVADCRDWLRGHLTELTG